jgi:hypothetical protein
VTRVTKRNGGIRKPEYRLWALLPILPFMFVGLFIVGITFEKRLAWIGESSNVSSRYRNARGRCELTNAHYRSLLAPLIGGALFYFCLSASTGILQTASLGLSFVILL